ncbi:TPA: hypothetical protein ACJI8J_001629 [Kluyvera georgiana]|uniref:cold shock small protein YmcF n=1 Tax=Kluyvera georgiana TaxID=73098 RepID=UPI001F0AF954|nr:hypothetical protein [Kluyvera georgiana]MDA8496156.1 hypothetical protein [Kluyvera georgiana]
MNLNIHFRCPCCHGSQYRTSIFDVSERNPFGAKCIFCKTNMVPNETTVIKDKSPGVSA